MIYCRLGRVMSVRNPEHATNRFILHFSSGKISLVSGCRITAITSAFQADDRGPTPLTRSKSDRNKHKVTKVNKYG